MVLCDYLKPLQLCILFCSFFMTTLYFPHVTALSFNISSQNKYVNMTIESNAYISPRGIQLTPDGSDQNNKSGRATYIEPLHLWDKASGTLADFSTHFLFVIDSQGQTNSADGLTFLLVPQNDSDIVDAGALGLPFSCPKMMPTSQFVAIEFDTFQNEWDPNEWDPHTPTHVGIDISSIISNATKAWNSNITYGAENEAWITYNSTSKNLSVAFTGFENNIRIRQDLSFIVDLRDHLPEWVRIGFSASTGNYFQKNTVKSWQFSSSLRVDETGGNNGTWLVVGLTVGLSVLVFGLALLGFLWWKRRIKAKEDDEPSSELSMKTEFDTGRGPKRFSYVELSRATNNFDEEQKLGEGGFGGVYRGFLKESNSYVAVKRISKGSKQGIKEYASEVKIISRLRHRNLVQLIGWCHEKTKLLLVYEFMANASLDIHLYKSKSLLPWKTRYRIAKSLASALFYLHEGWEQCVLHRDVKSSNVMVDQNFNAKLGDFGLARLVDHEKGTQTTALAGTMGYMAPECMVTGQASKKSDVYSFGVVALEIACGRKPINTSVQESQLSLVEFVWNLYGRGNLLDAVDPKISTNFDREESERLMIVGLWCAHPDNNFRPSIGQAIQVLNFEASLPVLPRKMPVATYSSLLVNSDIFD